MELKIFHRIETSHIEEEYVNRADDEVDYVVYVYLTSDCERALEEPLLFVNPTLGQQNVLENILSSDSPTIQLSSETGYKAFLLSGVGETLKGYSGIYVP